MVKRRWRQSRTSHALLLVLLVAQYFDVFLHKRGVCTTEDVSLFQVFLLHIEEGLCVKVVVSHQRVQLEVIVPNACATCISELSKCSFSFDSEGKASVECLDLGRSLPLSSALQSITLDLIDFLLVTNAAEVAPDCCLQPNHRRHFLQHSVQQNFSASALTHDVVRYRATRGTHLVDFSQVPVEKLIVEHFEHAGWVTAGR